METYKTVGTTETLNKYIKLGWKRIHVFTRATEFDDDGKAAQFQPAFVIVWDCPGDPPTPESTAPRPLVTPTDPETS